LLLRNFLWVLYFSSFPNNTWVKILLPGTIFSGSTCVTILTIRSHQCQSSRIRVRFYTIIWCGALFNYELRFIRFSHKKNSQDFYQINFFLGTGIRLIFIHHNNFFITHTFNQITSRYRFVGYFLKNTYLM
jgi:hypothetical protein